MGPQAKAAVPALVGLLRFKEDGLSWWTTEALKKIDPVAAKKVGVR
jgi:hypothetical protein